MKLLVITRLRSFVESSRVMTVTRGSFWKVVARLPCWLHVSTTCLNSGSFLSINASAPALSGLSPDRASETISPGRPTGRASLPCVSKAPPGIDCTLAANFFCRAMRTQSPAYSELPEPERITLETPRTSEDISGARRCISLAVHSQVAGCWRISRSVW